MVIVKKDKNNPRTNRDLYYICEKYIKSNEYKILTITGNRRLGKTTILKTLNNNFDNCIMITLNNTDTVDDILKFLENNIDKYEVFLIDEFCMNQDIFDNGNIIFDYLINSNKKAILTGTYNLAIRLMEQNQSFGRTINYTLNTLTYVEYIDILGDNDYLKYINFTDFNNSTEEIYINSVIDNIIISYEKYIKLNNLDIALSKEKVKFYTYIILFKMILNSDENLKNTISIEGLKFSNYLNQKVMDRFRKEAKFFEEIDLKELDILLEQLIKLKVIKFIKPLDQSEISKVIIENFVLKRYIYVIIEECISDSEISNFKITHYGFMYENIMNMQTSIYSDNTYEQMYFKREPYEIDDIIIMDKYIELVEYKSGKFKENKLLSNKLFLDELKSKYGKEVRVKYVGKIEDDKICRDIEYLKELRKLYLDKFKEKSDFKLDWGI